MVKDSDNRKKKEGAVRQGKLLRYGFVVSQSFFAIYLPSARILKLTDWEVTNCKLVDGLADTQRERASVRQV